MDLTRLWAITQVEKRIILSLKRYWVFLLLAYIGALGFYLLASTMHAAYSFVSVNYSAPAPRNLLTYIAVTYLGIFLTGAIFLAFEIRARDVRYRMLDIIDSKPYLNIELVLGRFLALFICAWVPIVVLLVILQVIGWILPLMGSPIGGTLEPLSLLGFAVYMAIPAIFFSCALVILITLLVRLRIVALILSAMCIYGSYAVLATQPPDIARTFDLLGTIQINQPSQWIPSIANSSWWLQRLGLLFLALGFLFFAVIVHPRLDSTNRFRQGMLAVVSSVIGVILVANAFQWQRSEFEQIDRWRGAHEEKRGQSFPDIVSMDGALTLVPGENLSMALDLVFQTPEQAALNTALFSLNPGFVIDKVTDENNTELEVSFQHGLLEISLPKPLQADDTHRIHIRYHGKPNNQFAYLDSAYDVRKETASIDKRKVFGLEKGLFDKRYVALMPGIHWLPSSGVDVGRYDVKEQSRDFYRAKLNVKLPLNWIVAGPGQRSQISRSESKNEVEYQFSPKVHIPEIALLAAPFHSYSSTIEGITFEILLHPDHDNLIDVFAHSKEAIESWIAEKLSLAKDAGLEYPFAAFSLVEIPNTLRGHTGGWQMDTALSPPAMVLMRERSLPTARFDIGVENMVYRLFTPPPQGEQEQDRAQADRNRLIHYFSNDFSGGNVFSGFARSMFAYRTSASGQGAIALDYALKQLATLVFSGERSYFSIDKALTIDSALSRVLESELKQNESITQRLIDNYTASPLVWDFASRNSLIDIDPWQHYHLTQDVLALQSGQLAQLLYDALGPQGAGKFLATVIKHHKGSSYTLTDISTILGSTHPELSTILHDWFNNVGFSGFVADQVALYQLPRSDSGVARYQVKLRLTNDETAAGTVRLAWSTENGERAYSQAIRVAAQSAVEVGLLLLSPPKELFVDPYLSLNKSEFLAHQFDLSNITRKDIDAFEGVRDATAKVNSNNKIVIDDLDAGFSIVTDGQSEPIIASLVYEFGQHSPIKNYDWPSFWSRHPADSAWGKYRQTIAFVGKGSGNSRARFSTQIPNAGRWLLELHIPNRFLSLNYPNTLKQWELHIVKPQGKTPVYFDAVEAHSGWNIVGEYELEAADVSVEFSNKTQGVIVIADAVMWSPVN